MPNVKWNQLPPRKGPNPQGVKMELIKTMAMVKYTS